MYAIVEIAGQQFKVEEGKKIFVHRLEVEKDQILEFDKVLLVENGDNILVGDPNVANYIVEGKVLDHVRGDKVIVFKMKKKKGYRIKNGHRQNFSELEIIGIGEKGSIVRKEAPKRAAKAVKAEVVAEKASDEKSTPKKATAKKAATKKEAKEEAAPKAKKTAEKKPVAKKPAEKKPAVKKSTGKK